MRNHTTNDHRAFLLTTARVYVPGSMSEEVEVAPETSGGGCCGSAPAPSPAKSSGCATSGCGTPSTVEQRTGCC